MKRLLRRLGKDARSAVAIIFALSLVPLVSLVTLAVDYSFYVQARSQAALAADAAATHAVRAANAAYSYEQAQNDPNAAADAEAAGAGLGLQWFNATLGTMTRASINGTPSVSVTPNANGSAGFTAVVSFVGTYPPFFAGMFHSQPWHINGSAGASSSYNYVEILMLLDNSPSMLIGATPADILNLEAISACPPSMVDGSFGGQGYTGTYYQHVASPNPPPTYIDILPQTLIQHYTPGAYGANGYSADGKGYAQGSCANDSTGNWTGRGGVYAPCAFACHTTTNTMTFTQPNSTTSPFVDGTYPADFYGMARAYSYPSATPNTPPTTITLRLDVLQAAASDVINAMVVNQAAAGQFSVGVYQFNSDVVPIFPAPGGRQLEASTNLAGAATAIQNAAVPLQANGGIGYTNFPTSVADLLSGKYLTGATFGYTNPDGTTANGLQAAGDGSTSSKPQKDIFIVTDGMEDTSYPSGRNEGEMTGYNAEHAAASLANAPWVCKPLKNLGFTVYVLYIDYEPLSNVFYQTNPIASSKYIASDYPALVGSATKKYAESTAASEGNPPDPSVANFPPIETGLQACASTSSDFFEASSAAEIGTAMQAMLRSALTSSVRLTQ